MLIYQVVDRAYAPVQGNKPLVRVLTDERRIDMDWQGLREDFKQKHKERVAKTPQRIEYAKQEFEKHSIDAELKNEQTGQFNIEAGTHIITYYCSTGKILVDNKSYEQRGIKYAIHKAKELLGDEK